MGGGEGGKATLDSCPNMFFNEPSLRNIVGHKF